MKKAILSAVAVVMMSLAFRAQAATWNPFQSEGRVKAHTVILTGNYLQSRILAELAQYYKKQPVLLISPDSDGGSQVFYMPNSTEAKNIPAEEFMDLVNHIAPKRVIVLGGTDYVPRSFVDQIRAKYSMISLDSTDWSRNAASLGEIFEEKRLKSKFEEYVRAARSSSEAE